MIAFKTPELEAEYRTGQLHPGLRFLIRQVAALISLLAPGGEMVVTSLAEGRGTDPHRSGRACDFRVWNLPAWVVRVLLWTCNETWIRPLDSDGKQRLTLYIESSEADELAPFAGCPGVYLRDLYDEDGERKRVWLHLHLQWPAGLEDPSTFPPIL